MSDAQQSKPAGESKRMRVEYRTTEKPAPKISQGGRPGFDYYYEVVNIEFCCADMEHAWYADAVSFGELREADNYTDGVCIYSTECECDQPYHTSYPIQFCPFCGVKIETAEVARVRLVERVTQVEKVEYVEEETTKPG